MRLYGVVLLAGLLVAACDDVPTPGSSFFDERLQPVLEVGCAVQTNGCHVDVNGAATGNLDLSSFDALMQRSDVLPAYGPYSEGLLLLKGGDNINLTVETWDDDPISGERFAAITTDIKHNAGTFLAVESQGYRELRRWIQEGFARTGVPDETLVENQGQCRTELGHPTGFDPSVAPDAASFDSFVNNVQPVIRDTCAGSSCHGTPVADLYFTCGDNEEQLRWNYYVALSHVTTPAVSRSGLLRRPLTQLRGGTFHEGGAVFGSTDDPRYQVLRDWAQSIQDTSPELLVDDDPDPGLRYFANRVQPVLVRKGCMFLNCHAPAMFHDLRLRGGDQGVFSRIATRRNYEMSRLQLSVESPNINDSRLVAKNLYPPTFVDGAVGIQHRGGSLFEDFAAGGELNPATPDVCDGVDADNGDLNEIPAYCVLERWHEIEREEAIARGDILPDAVDSVVFVSRPPGTGDVRDFDTFRGGADLRSAPAMMDASGALTLGASTSLLGGCPVSAGADIRNPAVRWDGQQIAFAARASAGDTLRLYRMNPDGSGCEEVPDTDTPDGVHDFDPAYVPDGRLVFASTRGNVDGNVGYRGPTRTPANLQPNANLFILEDDSVRQMTFLLNQEVAPSFMADGRVIFTAEKRQFEFYQLALRRQNVDGGDYHPLFAQRESVGFRAATEVIELSNRNLAFVASHLPCTDTLPGDIPCAEDGAGGIMVVNRSIGPDQDDRGEDRDYIHSMRFAAPGAFGRIPNVPSGRMAAANGAFRSPSPLPSGRILVSCETGASDLSAGPFAYQLCELEPSTGAVRQVGGEAGMANVEGVAVYGRIFHEVFDSRADEANGATEILPERSEISRINIADFPLLATLLFANTREGRPIDFNIGGLRAFEAMPPPDSGDFGSLENVITDRFGPVYEQLDQLGFAPLSADGSVSIQIPGGMPLVIQPTSGGGDDLSFVEDSLFSGRIIQREQMQFYPGEHINQSFRRDLFNGLCGTCHGSITGRELDAAVDVDVLTRASRFFAMETTVSFER